MSDTRPSTSTAAVAGLIGASTTVVSAALVQLAIVPSTTVSDERWSYPWRPSELVAVSVIYAVLHLLVAAGLVAFARSGAMAPSTGRTWGLRLAMAGTLVLTVAELGSVPIRDALLVDGSAQAVGGLFAVGILLSAAGFLTLGVLTLRQARWSGWRRFAPVALGGWTVVLVGLAPTKALSAGVALYGAGLLAVAVATITEPDVTART